jgi:diketogulonate reductase-like aldo/keto reductase
MPNVVRCPRGSPSSHPISGTVGAFKALQQAGKIRHWGVSNFDVREMEELLRVGGEKVTTNQVLYNLSRRAIEYDLMPWQQKRGIPLMAYSPIEQGRLAHHRSLSEVAVHHNATPAQIALAWVLAQRPWIAPIPGTTKLHRLDENLAALDVELTPDDLRDIESAASRIAVQGARYSEGAQRMIDR